MKKLIIALCLAATPASACYGIGCEEAIEGQRQADHELGEYARQPHQKPPTNLFDRDNRYGNGPHHNDDDDQD